MIITFIDKDKDVQKETERIRRHISAEKQVQEELKKEIAQLKSQLEESNQGLLAAARLSDQLETSKKTISMLNKEGIVNSLYSPNNNNNYSNNFSFIRKRLSVKYQLVILGCCLSQNIGRYCHELLCQPSYNYLHVSLV